MMIAMQYRFVLPADYDMAIIDRRIRNKGPMLDGFPKLRIKAYLSARKHDDGFTSAENLYAPFYLWDEPEGLSNFLTGPAFAALTNDLGWPRVRTWMVWSAQLSPHVREAKFATEEVVSIKPYADLATLRGDHVARVETALRDGALVAATAFDPSEWTVVQFRLWQTLPAEHTQAGIQTYRVGHISLP
jgi:hypothetical protein